MRYPGATWRGPVPNRTPGGMVRPVRGLVLHVEQGFEGGTDAWFHNPAARVSAHFGNPRAGSLVQWVDTDDAAWAQAAGNRGWISLENEGNTGDELTPGQLDNAAELLAWLHTTEGIPLELTDTPAGVGLGWHGMGGGAWGAHPDCPGAPIVAQRAAICARAVELTKGADPMGYPNAVAACLCPTGGSWTVAADGGVFANGAPFYGSYPMLPAAEREGTRRFLSIEPIAVPGGGVGYAILADDGAAYRFTAAVLEQLQGAA